MKYSMASNIKTRKIVWVPEGYTSPFTAVQVSAINRKLAEV